MTLDDDLAERLRELAHERRQPFKRVVNDTLRRGLAPLEPARRKQYTQASDLGLRPGLEMVNFNRLASDLEDEEIIRKLEQGR